MSQVPPSTSYFTIFIAAMKLYEKRTKTDIASHPLTAALALCDSPHAIRALLRAQVPGDDQSADGKLTKWLDPTVNVLCAFTETLGNAVGLVITRKLSPLEICPLTCVTQAFPPATLIFTGIGVLLQVSVFIQHVGVGNTYTS
jgi:hypothetical protein